MPHQHRLPGERGAGAVLVGVDGSPGSRRAAEVALEEAGRRRSRLVLVHVVPRSPRGLPPVPSAALLERAEGVLESARAALEPGSGLHPDDVETELLTGRAAAMLVEAAGPSDLLVVGRHDGSRQPGPRWGSVGLAVVCSAPCPVLVVPPGHVPDAQPATGRVVVGLDGTPRSSPALAVAVEEAERRDAELVAVHCWEGVVPDLADLPDSAEVAELWRQPTERAVAEALAGLSVDHPDLVVTHEEDDRRPLAGLLAWSRRADLVVVGVRGGGGLAGLLLGSVALGVAGGAACPVELVRRGSGALPRTRWARRG